MDNKHPLVSVVIPVYKVEKYLKQSVKSVIDSTYKNTQIILVDDGSPDNCPQICDEFASTHSNISVIHKENGGLSSARNAGIHIANGEYILFLDSDDTLCADAIEGMIISALQTNADIIMPDRYIKVFENTKEEKLVFHFDKECYINTPIDFAVEVMIGKGRAWRAHSLLYKHNVIKNNNINFPVGYTSEDIIFNLDVMIYAKNISFYPHSTIRYLKREGSITSSFDPDFINTIWFIDEKVKDFLIKANRQRAEDMNKKNSLLCRNIITYLTSFMSKKNTMNYSNKSKTADLFLLDQRVAEAFKDKPILPYFNSNYIIKYFSLLYFFMRKKQYRIVKLVAYTANKLIGEKR